MEPKEVLIEAFFPMSGRRERLCFLLLAVSPGLAIALTGPILKQWAFGFLALQIPAGIYAYQVTKRELGEYQGSPAIDQLFLYSLLGVTLGMVIRGTAKGATTSGFLTLVILGMGLSMAKGRLERRQDLVRLEARDRAREHARWSITPWEHDNTTGMLKLRGTSLTESELGQMVKEGKTIAQIEVECGIEEGFHESSVESYRNVKLAEIESVLAEFDEAKLQRSDQWKSILKRLPMMFALSIAVSLLAYLVGRWVSHL